MKKNFLTLSISALVAFTLTGCNKVLLDPISSAKSHDVDGRTYEQILAQSGRCENPKWTQDTPDITWQDSVRSDIIKVTVVCQSKLNMTLLEQQPSIERDKFNIVLSRTVKPADFEQARIRYEEKMSDKTPPYDENRMKQLAKELCKFPDVSSFSEFVNALRMPHDSCKPTDEQKAKLKEEFAFKYGVLDSYILSPFFEAYATEAANNVNNTNLNDPKFTNVLDIEEKVTFGVQYSKTGRSGRRMRNATYEAGVGRDHYELKVNGKVKMQRNHPSISEIFSHKLTLEQ